MKHSREYYCRVKKRKMRRRLILAVVCLVLAAAIAITVFSCNQKSPQSEGSSQSGSQAAPPAPEQPYVVAKAKIGSTGDILIHSPILSNAKKASGEYDFGNILPKVSSYFSDYDYMVANLEVTCGGEDAGEYAGYPVFNTPDSIVDAFKSGGVDMLLTANNHTYDTGMAGMLRTIDVIKQRGIDYLGTRSDESESFYTIKDFGGLKIGLICYTYETASSVEGRKSLNGNLMKAEAGGLVNSFKYDDLNAFYADAKAAFNSMKAAGADAVIYYMHWGNEYQRTPSSYQKNIAQKLSDIGVDVIIGGHPHVIQPFETLTGAGGNKTVCIYSMGNAVSNQRKEIMDSDNYSGHTEDGMVFEVEFEKWSNGTVKLTDVNILPTWVNMKTESGKRVYEIIPLDVNTDWLQFGLSGSKLNNAKASYNRTMKLVGAGLNEYRAANGLEAVKTVME